MQVGNFWKLFLGVLLREMGLCRKCKVTQNKRKDSEVSRSVLVTNRLVLQRREEHGHNSSKFFQMQNDMKLKLISML